MHQSKIAVETKCNSIKSAFLNIRSLKNNTFLINDLITTNYLDCLLLNKTWLEDSCSVTVLNETAPPNFNFTSVCRTVGRGGGVAVIFKYVYQCKQVSFGQYLSSEYLGIVLKGAPRILFIIIYWPPKCSPAFVKEFIELLSMIWSSLKIFLESLRIRAQVCNMISSEVKMGRGSPIFEKLHKMIVEYFKNNVPQCKITKALQISSSIVHNIIKRFRETGEISLRMGQGRRPLLDACGLRALRQHCNHHRHDSVIDITKWAQEYFQKPLSVNTIRRAICRCQLKRYHAKRKPYVDIVQKRVLWAKAHLKWTKWKKIFYDQTSQTSTFLLEITCPPG